MFPAFAGLLPGLIQAGGKFLKRTGKDILAGKNVLQSAKENAVMAADEILPGAGKYLEKGIEAVSNFVKGRGKKKALAPAKGSGIPDSMLEKANKFLKRAVIDGDVRKADVVEWRTLMGKAHNNGSGPRYDEMNAINDKLGRVPAWRAIWNKKYPDEAYA